MEEDIWRRKQVREIRELFGEQDKVWIIRDSRLECAGQILKKIAGKITNIIYNSLPEKRRPIGRQTEEGQGIHVNNGTGRGGGVLLVRLTTSLSTNDHCSV